jgi:hypothetical protein
MDGGRGLPPSVPIHVFGFGRPAGPCSPDSWLTSHLADADRPHAAAVIGSDHLMACCPTPLVSAELGRLVSDLQDDPT